MRIVDHSYVLIVPMRNWNRYGVIKDERDVLCFDRTYEELKQHFREWLRRICRVLIVPMRNWNPSHPQRFAHPGDVGFDRTYEELKRCHPVPLPTSPEGFDRTYEELKHRSTIEKAILTPWVLIVPMRNWNKQASGPNKVRLLVLIVPMRNWNMQSDIRSKLEKSSFDRTYEELKPAPWSPEPSCRVRRFDRTYEELKQGTSGTERKAPDAFWSYLWGIETSIIPNGLYKVQSFDRTYEELKPEPPDSFPPCGWSFDRTYEELKLRTLCVDFIDNDVLIVPMRNWNLFPGPPDVLKIRFWSYLWGIETSLSRARQTFHERFDRTYEELKLLDAVRVRVILGQVLIVPMRNWNTASVSVPSTGNSEFWSYLWGIETSRLLEKWCW